MSTFEAALTQLPEPILDKLKSLISRVRRLMFVRGFFATLAVGIGCLLVIMAIDASVTIFSSAVRWGLSLAGLAITLFAGWWFLVRPLSRKITLTNIARILEVRHPELQERISTAVELMSSDDPDSIKGSEELIGAVVDSAVTDVEAVDPKSEFKPAKATRFVMVAGVGALMIAVVMLVWPKQGWTLLARAFAPFLDIGNAYADTMVVEPGDLRVAVGEPVTIQMTVEHDRLNRAELRRKLPDGSESVERMTLMGETEDGEKRFTITFPAVADSFEYRVRAGNAVSEFYDVTAVPPPTVVGLTVRYDFPEYTQLDPVEGPSETGEIRALAHTEVTVTAQLNKAVTEGSKLLVNDSQEMGEPVFSDMAATWKFPLKPKMQGTWRLELEDADGFTNVPENYSIQALPDKAPRVVIQSPTHRELRLKPSEMLPIKYAVTEDYGFSQIDLLVTPNGEPNPREIVQPTPEADGEAGVWRGMAPLNLASLDLENHHRRLEVQLRARDNRPTDLDGPGEGLSEKIVIILDRNAESLAKQTIREQKQELQQAIREAEQKLQQAKSDTQEVERQLERDKDEVNDQAERQLKEFQEHTKEAQDKLAEIAEKLEESVFAKQAEAAENIAEEEIAEAREAADMIPVSDEKDERVAEAKKAKEQVEEALDELKDLAESIKEADDDLQMVAELNDLANEQRELAQEAAENAEESAELAQNENASPQEQDRNQREQDRQMDEFQRQQERVQDELGDLVKENASALEEVLEGQREEAEKLAEEAKEMAEQQKNLAEMTREASQAKSEEQQQEMQEKIMQGLQEMQEQIAKDTSDLQEELNEQQPGAGEPLEKAAEETQEAAENLAQADAAENQENPAKGQESESAESPESQPAGQEKPQSNEAEAQAQADAGEEASQPEAGENSPTEQGEAKSEMQQAAESAQEAAEALAEAQAQSEAAAAEEMSGESGEENSASESAESQTAQAETGEPSAETGEPAAPENGEPVEGGQPENGEPAAGEESQMAEAEAGEASEAGEESSPFAASETQSELGDLAEAQAALAEQIAAVAEGNFEEALESMEAQMAESAGELQEATEALETALENTQQNAARSQADRAENALEQAAREAAQASQQMERAAELQAQADARAEQAAEAAAQQGKPAPAQPPAVSPPAQSQMQQSAANQQQAAQQMAQAARALEQTAQAIGQAMDRNEPGEADDNLVNSSELAESFEQVSESAQSQTPQQAAQQSQQAAESLQQMMQNALAQMGALGQDGQNPPGQQDGQPKPEDGPQTLAQMMESQNPQLNESGKKMGDAFSDTVPEELKALGVTVDDWAKFKGTLTGGSATAIDTQLPSEYRELVGRYFQVIAKEAKEK